MKHFNPKDFDTDSSFNYKEWNCDTVYDARLFHRSACLAKQYFAAYASDEEAWNYPEALVFSVISDANSDYRNGLLTQEEFVLVVDNMIHY